LVLLLRRRVGSGARRFRRGPPGLLWPLRPLINRLLLRRGFLPSRGLVASAARAPAARWLLGGGGVAAAGAFGRGLLRRRLDLARLHGEVDYEGGGPAARALLRLVALLLLFLLLAAAPAAPAAAPLVAAAGAPAPAARAAPAASAALLRLRLVVAVEVELVLDVGLVLVVGDALLGGVGEGVAGLVPRHLLPGDGEELGEVIREVGEVQEGVLLLTDVHERRLDGGHDLADAAEVDVAEGAD